MLNFSLCLLALSGLFYNVRPFRFMDRPYLDFSFEAINNPIRLMVGWYLLTPAHIPAPASFVLSFWFLGCFLMAAKRFGERRLIPNPQAATRYRQSLRFYTEQNLLCAMICSLVAFSFLLGFFCMKPHKVVDRQEELLALGRGPLQTPRRAGRRARLGFACPRRADFLRSARRLGLVRECIGPGYIHQVGRCRFVPQPLLSRVPGRHCFSPCGLRVTHSTCA